MILALVALTSWRLRLASNLDELLEVDDTVAIQIADAELVPECLVVEHVSRDLLDVSLELVRCDNAIVVGIDESEGLSEFFCLLGSKFAHIWSGSIFTVAEVVMRKLREEF